MIFAAAALDQLFREARSYNQFTDRPVDDATLRQLYELLKWGPTSMNTQPGRYLFVRSAEAKQLVDGCPQITSINLGNTKSKDEQRPDARKISRQIFVTAAEEEDIRELAGRGIEVEIRALADDPKVDAVSAL